MPENKHMKWADSLRQEARRDSRDDTLDRSQQAANDADGWQQYRHWVSKTPAPRRRRSGIDPSLYSWKGYRAWSDQVKRSWSKDQGEDQ